MTISRKITLSFWYLPVLGFVTAIFAFLLGCIGLLFKGGKPVGLGLINMAHFLINPIEHQCKIYSTNPFKREPDWIRFKSGIKLAFYPFGTILYFLLLVQWLVLCISLVGIPVHKRITSIFPLIYTPELIKSIYK